MQHAQESFQTLMHHLCTFRWYQVNKSQLKKCFSSQSEAILLYSLYVNGFLVELKNSGLGARLGNIYTGAPMHVCWLSSPDRYLPEELQLKWTLSRIMLWNWRYSLHPGKSKTMIFDCINPPPWCWKLGGDTIEVVEQHLHLGILHSTNSTSTARTILQTSSFFALNMQLWYLVWLHSPTHSLVSSSH